MSTAATNNAQSQRFTTEFLFKKTTTTAYSHLVCAFTCDFFLMGNVDAHDSCINNHFYPIKELITSPVAC